jgi:hypothetical protein
VKVVKTNKEMNENVLKEMKVLEDLAQDWASAPGFSSGLNQTYLHDSLINWWTRWKSMTNSDAPVEKTSLYPSYLWAKSHIKIPHR